MSFPGFESAGFHAIAAEFHVAPAASVVFAGVDEEPAAFWIVAGPQEVHGFSGHEIGCGQCEQPEREFRFTFHAGQAPLEVGLIP